MQTTTGETVQLFSNKVNCKFQINFDGIEPLKVASRFSQVSECRVSYVFRTKNCDKNAWYNKIVNK